MIRPFHLTDLALVHRLGEHSVRLQAQAALTSVSHPTRKALSTMLLGGSYATYVWKSEANEAVGFVQLVLDEGSPNAQIANLGTERQGNSDAPVDKESDWLTLLDELVAEAGKRGIHNLIAEVDEEGDELTILRKAGFAIYTRQDIWFNQQPQVTDAASLVEPKRQVDEWDVHVLYANIVPALIQSVEPGPRVACGQNWTRREDGELVAYIHFEDGPVASWLQLLIHPNADVRPKDIIRAALAANDVEQGKPVYCCVRRYQSWLQSSLDKAGFQWWGSQAVMVKHMVKPVKQQVTKQQLGWEKQAVPGSSPLVQSLSRPNGGARGNS